MQAIDFAAEFRRSEIGRALGPEVCCDLFRAGEIRTWPRDSLIFQEGDASVGIYIVADGLVKLTRYSDEGRETILHLAEPFTIIAEGAVFLGRYPATAVAIEKSTLVLVRKERVQELIDRHPPFQRRFFDSMAQWLKLLVDKIDQLTLNDATARVARYLLDLKWRNQPQDRSPGREVRLPIKKGELAKMLNMNQATLSRTLRYLQDENVIEVQGRKFKLRDLDLLRRLSIPPLD